MRRMGHFVSILLQDIVVKVSLLIRSPVVCCWYLCDSVLVSKCSVEEVVMRMGLQTFDVVHQSVDMVETTYSSWDRILGQRKK